MRRRFHLIANALAGRGLAGETSEVAGRLKAAGADVVRGLAGGEAAALEEAREAARSGRFDAVLAAGGDGTIRLAARAVAGTGVPIGVIPLGTGNVLAHEVGLPRAPEALTALLLEGPARKLATARVNGEVFLLMVGVGFDGRIIAALDHDRKRAVGKLAYAGPLLAAIRAPADRLRVTADGIERSAGWVIAANAGRYGGRFQLTRRTRVEAPGLVVIHLAARTVAERIAHLFAIARGRLDHLADAAGEAAGVVMVPARRLVVAATDAVPVQVDGDRAGTTPVEIEAGGPEVLLISPAHRQ